MRPDDTKSKKNLPYIKIQPSPDEIQSYGVNPSVIANPTPKNPFIEYILPQTVFSQATKSFLPNVNDGQPNSVEWNLITRKLAPTSNVDLFKSAEKVISVRPIESIKPTQSLQLTYPQEFYGTNKNIIYPQPHQPFDKASKLGTIQTLIPVVPVSQAALQPAPVQPSFLSPSPLFQPPQLVTITPQYITPTPLVLQPSPQIISKIPLTIQPQPQPFPVASPPPFIPQLFEPVQPSLLSSIKTSFMLYLNSSI